MNNGSPFLQLLQDPSGEFNNPEYSLADQMGSMDKLSIPSSATETLFFSLEHMDLLSRIKNKNGSFSDQLVGIVGMENREILEMIGRGLRTAFEAVKMAIVKSIRVMRDFFKDIIKIDERLKISADNKLKELIDQMHKLRADQLTRSEENFVKMTMRDMLSYKEFTDLMHAYGIVCDTLHRTVKPHILNSIRRLTDANIDTTVIDWMDVSLVGHLKTLGIIVSNEQKVAYSTRFLSAKENTLGTMQYSRIAVAKDISDMYNTFIWNKYRDMRTTISTLENFRDEVERKEKEIVREGTFSQATVMSNIAHLHKQINLYMSLFRMLRSCNLTANYRRKRLIEYGLRAINLDKNLNPPIEGK